ncbi:SUKH-4 family immunity protein [Streptomyces sp. NPDC004111]|uniref:SUKH-4 family immunity protein n=1 Tax=Streptomyces sp. NPDC004111 TaxID=3364690 RepID=UPI0036C5DF07
MNFTVTPGDLLRSYGLNGVVYFPRTADEMDARTSLFLSSVGLPDSEVFHTRADVEEFEEGDGDAITLGSRFDEDGMTCPPESRSWLKLGYFFTSLLALDPASGKVFSFPEGSAEYLLIHRDIESLVYSFIEFRKIEVGHENEEDPEELSTRFRETVGQFDATPFTEEESPWNLALEELENEIW